MCAVTDGILRVAVHLSEGLAVALGDEDGVVAEARVASAFLGDAALHDTFKRIRLSLIDEGDGRA